MATVTGRLPWDRRLTAGCVSGTKPEEARPAPEPSQDRNLGRWEPWVYFELQVPTLRGRLRELGRPAIFSPFHRARDGFEQPGQWIEDFTPPFRVSMVEGRQRNTKRRH